MRAQRLARFNQLVPDREDQAQDDHRGRPNREAGAVVQQPRAFPRGRRWRPSDEEIARVCQIFPDLDNGIVRLALVQAGSIENAVQFLMGA